MHFVQWRYGLALVELIVELIISITFVSFVDGSTCVPVFRHVANHKTCQEECGKLHCCEASKSNNECIILRVICVSFVAL